MVDDGSVEMGVAADDVPVRVSVTEEAAVPVAVPSALVVEEMGLGTFKPVQTKLRLTAVVTAPFR